MPSQLHTAKATKHQQKVADEAKLEFIDSVMSLLDHGLLIPIGSDSWSENQLLEFVTLGGELRFAVCSAKFVEAIGRALRMKKYVDRGILTSSEAVQDLAYTIGKFAEVTAFVEMDFPEQAKNPDFPDGYSQFLGSFMHWLNLESDVSECANNIKISTGVRFLEQIIAADDCKSLQRAADRLQSSLRVLEAEQVCKVHQDAISDDDQCPGAVLTVQFLSHVDRETVCKFEQAYRAWLHDELSAGQLATQARQLVCKTTSLTANAWDDAYNMMAELWITVAGNGLESTLKQETEKLLVDQIQSQVKMLLSMLRDL